MKSEKLPISTDTVEQRLQIFNAFMHAQNIKNSSKETFCMSNGISIDLLNKIFEEFETSFEFPSEDIKLELEHIIIEFLAEGGNLNIYKTFLGFIRINNSNYWNLSDALKDQNITWQATAPRIYNKAYTEELRAFINEEIKENGEQEFFKYYKEDWEKELNAKFTEWEPFTSVAPITQTVIYYKPEEYKDGYVSGTKTLFSDSIKEWEELFFKNHTPLFANYVFASISTIELLAKCYQLNENEELGMDLQNGKIDIDAQEKIDMQTGIDRTYSLGSQIPGNENRALFLVADDSLRDDVIVMKYIG